MASGVCSELKKIIPSIPCCIETYVVLLNLRVASGGGHHHLIASGLNAFLDSLHDAGKKLVENRRQKHQDFLVALTGRFRPSVLGIIQP